MELSRALRLRATGCCRLGHVGFGDPRGTHWRLGNLRLGSRGNLRLGSRGNLRLGSRGSRRNNCLGSRGNSNWGN